MLRKSIVAGKAAHAGKHVLSEEGEQGGEPHTTIETGNNETAQTKSDGNNEIYPHLEHPSRLHSLLSAVSMCRRPQYFDS